MNYSDALKRPFTSLKRLAIGIILNAIPIANFFACGYILECLSQKKELPEWKNWGGLFVKGFHWTLISIVYAAIPIIMLIYSFGAKTFDWQKLSEAIAANPLPGITAGAIACIAVYITPSAIREFATTGKTRNAFKAGTIAKAFKKEYFKATLTAFCVFTASTIILSAITAAAGNNTGAKIVSSAASTFISEITLFTLLGEQA